MLDEKRKKLDDKGEACIFVGYNGHSKAYKLYNSISKKIMINRDVIFNEEKAFKWNVNVGKYVAIDLIDAEEDNTDAQVVSESSTPTL